MKKVKFQKLKRSITSRWPVKWTLANKIELLNIDLISEWTEDKYEKEKAKFIAEYKIYVRGYSVGFFGWKDGEYRLDAIQGAAEWVKKYPSGFQSWRAGQMVLTGYGQQLLIDKINEIIKSLEK